MAMDKEMLLQRLQSQYLTRQEVLYKLPLNISISTFWPELVERRKMNSVVLPLHRADGKPMWYVLTDKMIAASEKLCALALDCSETIDPYKARMTSAMTEEIFFTSFVEGAQITLQEAMEFLERGTEPENVQEQMIQNNRQAWTDLTQMLYYPLDDRFVRMLAYRLTDEMEGHATDYRQTDTHIIAAMGKEVYEIPPAAAIPGLMQEFYDFLASTEIHPLIKAAVGQAYLLVIRPFPEGNERLARLVSYAVLLRSGYDFLRDISISSMIARESFRYFKSMQDIIRSENGGDLTYFVEYYLDLLARSIDAKAEQDQRRREEALLLERQTATQPLARTNPPPQIEKKMPTVKVIVPSAEPPFRQERVEITAVLEEPQKPIHVNCAEPEAKPNESPPRILESVDDYLHFLQETRNQRMKATRQHRADRVYEKLTELANAKEFRITRTEWQQMTDTTQSVTRDDFELMERLGLVISEAGNKSSDPILYHLPVKEDGFSPPPPVSAEKVNSLEDSKLRKTILRMKESQYSRERQAAAGLLEMLDEGKEEFTFSEWMMRNPVANKDTGFTILRVAMNFGLLEYDDGVYRFPLDVKEGPKCYHLPDKQRELLLKLMDAFPDEKFTVRNVAELTGIKYGTVSYYLENFTQRGILKVTKAPANINYYEFASEVHGIFQAAESEGDPATFKQMPEQEKEVHNPMRGMAEVG